MCEGIRYENLTELFRYNRLCVGGLVKEKTISIEWVCNPELEETEAEQNQNYIQIDNSDSDDFNYKIPLVVYY